MLVANGLNEYFITTVPEFVRFHDLVTDAAILHQQRNAMASCERRTPSRDSNVPGMLGCTY